MEQLWELFIGFFRASNLAYGGGPAIIPLIKVETLAHAWLTTEQFTEALAICSSLPGPIATLLSGYVGYNVAGWAGVFAALLGTLLLTSVAVIALTDILLKNKESPLIKGALTGVRPLVVILVAKTSFDMSLTAFTGWWSWFIAAVALVALFKFRLHPGIVILLSMAFGILVFR